MTTKADEDNSIAIGLLAIIGLFFIAAGIWVSFGAAAGLGACALTCFAIAFMVAAGSRIGK